MPMIEVRRGDTAIFGLIVFNKYTKTKKKTSEHQNVLCRLEQEVHEAGERPSSIMILQLQESI